MGSKEIIIGNGTLMGEKNIVFDEYENKIKEFESDGKTTMIVSENRIPLGIIAVADALKKDSIEAISTLNEKGYKTIMITGDNERTAKAIAKKVGISSVIAGVLPEDKTKKVEELQTSQLILIV